MNGQEQNYKNRLEENRRNNPGGFKETANRLRKAPALAKDVKDQAKKAFAAMSLIKYLDPFLDWLFGFTITFAILKDILDYTGWDFLGLGQIFNLLFSFIIFMSLYLTGGSKKKDMVKSIMKRYGTVLTGLFLELIPAIDFLPTETIVVVIAFYFTLQGRQEAEEEKELAAQEAYA